MRGYASFSELIISDIFVLLSGRSFLRYVKPLMKNVELAQALYHGWLVRLYTNLYEDPLAKKVRRYRIIDVGIQAIFFSFSHWSYSFKLVPTGAWL